MNTAETGNRASLDNPRWVNTAVQRHKLGVVVNDGPTVRGVRWFEAGWHKTPEDAWTGGGAAVKGFWEGAVAVPELGRPPIAYDWYREFLEFLLNAGLHGLFGWLIAWVNWRWGGSDRRSTHDEGRRT